MGRAQARLSHNVLGSLAVLTIIAGLGVGLPALNRTLPSAKPVSADRPYLVSNRVTVVPPRGAALDLTQSQPGVQRGRALFLLGGVRYALTVQAFTGGLAAAAASLRREITANHGYQIMGREVPVRTAQGVPGLQGGYSSPGRVGQYTVFLSAGTSVEVTFAGADPDLRAALPALQASIASIAFLGPS